MIESVATGLYFEDFSLGMEWVTPRRTVTSGDVAGFAGFAGVPQQVSAAGVPVLHEAGVVAIATGLAWVRLGINEGTAMPVLAMENWQFERAVSVGETIHVVQKVIELRESRSKPDRGIVRFDFEIRTHTGERSQRGEWVFLWSRKQR